LPEERRSGGDQLFSFGIMPSMICSLSFGLILKSRWHNMANRKSELPIVWDTNERERLKELVEDIKKRSENLAKPVKDRIRENLNLVQQNPKIFQVDSLKQNNDGTFKRFTAIHIIIVYKIDPDKIIIVRVRHSASEPKAY
jgi:plasmid stabilization system protein ParE